MTTERLAEALLWHLAAREATVGHLLYTPHLIAWGEAKGLSAAERNTAAETCLERGWIEQSDSPVRGAFRLTECGFQAMQGLS